MISSTIFAVVVLVAFACFAAETPLAVNVSVGPDKADIAGSDSFALQKAADLVAKQAPQGGGILLIKAGTYTMHDSLHIRVPMTVRGEGEKTLLHKHTQYKTRLTQDFDLSEFVAKVEDPSGLRVGMGVSILDKREHGGWSVTVRTIVAIDGHDVRLDRRPDRDYGYASEAWMQNSFPLVSAREVSGVTVEDLVVDGNMAENKDIFIDGCRAGGIYFHDVKNCTVRRCLARNFNGDGISWQTTSDMLVEDCQAIGNANLGLHPGTGSPRTTIRRCRAIHNGSIGLFLCWGVRNSTFEDNVLEDNGQHGISIGHKDSDNLFVNNQVRRNGTSGVCFRDEMEQNAGHRCTLGKNVIEDNGRAGKGGTGVLINGVTRDTVLEGNIIRDTRSGGERTQTVAVDAGAKTSGTVIKADNQVEGEVRGVKK